MKYKAEEAFLSDFIGMYMNEKLRQQRAVRRYEHFILFGSLLTNPVQSKCLFYSLSHILKISFSNIRFKIKTGPYGPVSISLYRESLCEVHTTKFS